MKKFFIAMMVLFGVFLVFFLIYLFLFRNNPLDGKVSNMTVIENKKEPEVQKQEDFTNKKIAPFIEEEGSSLYFDTRENMLFYLVPSENVLKKTPILSVDPRTVVTFSFEPKNIIWSPDGEKALVEKSTTEWVLFTKETKELKDLQGGVESPTWTALGDKIMFKFYDSNTGKRFLNVSDPDGSNPKVIGETPFQLLVTAAIPKSSSFAFWNQGNSFEKTSFKTIPVFGGVAKEVFSLNYGADYSFSPDGQKILVSSVAQKGSAKILIALMNTNGGGYKNLFVPSFVGKTVWSKNSQTLYYALPGALPEETILPNDYYQKPLLTSDTFWKVDTESGEKTRIAETSDIDQKYDAENLVLDTEETMLFFVNRHDWKIYRINL